MNKSPVTIIKKLIKLLPAKDVPLAEKLIQNRDFEALKELVDSDIYILKRNSNAIISEEDYFSSPLTALTVLQSEINSYLLLLGVPEEEVYEEIDFEDEQ